MGCSTCKTGCKTGEGGCGPRKEQQRARLDSLIAQRYPQGCWGEPLWTDVDESGIGADEVLTLAQELSTVNKAPCYVVPGGEDDLCHFVYVLCIGREPSLIELRDEVQRGQRPTLWLEGEQLRERYLRLCLSTLTRVACVQEVALELDLEAPASPGAPVAGDPLARLREVPLPGVFTPGLLKRLQRTVDLLQAHDIEHLDMGLLDVDASAFGLKPGEYPERFGAPPSLLNYFFYAQPVQMTTVSWLPAEVRASAQS
jgi:hypothetical protein